MCGRPRMFRRQKRFGCLDGFDSLGGASACGGLREGSGSAVGVPMPISGQVLGYKKEDISMETSISFNNTPTWTSIRGVLGGLVASGRTVQGHHRSVEGLSKNQVQTSCLGMSPV